MTSMQSFSGGSSIKKVERPDRFQMREFEDYTITYACNSITKRMNKILTCKLCSKQFKQLCSLNDHLRLHRQEKPFQCEYCGKGWSQAGNRDRHQANKSCLRGKKGRLLQESLKESMKTVDEEREDEEMQKV